MHHKLIKELVERCNKYVKCVDPDFKVVSSYDDAKQRVKVSLMAADPGKAAVEYDYCYLFYAGSALERQMFWFVRDNDDNPNGSTFLVEGRPEIIVGLLYT